jgi:hypothetical protein
LKTFPAFLSYFFERASQSRRSDLATAFPKSSSRADVFRFALDYATDRLGRRYRVNHAVRVTKGGVQLTMWAIIGNAPRSHMQKAFIQRREQIVGDCVQLSTDVEVYNDINKEQPPIPMLFDFRDDIAERRTWDDSDAA